MIQRSSHIVTPKLASGRHRQRENMMNITNKTSWQITAVTAAALFAGVAQATDRGHSGGHDGYRDRHGWQDQGRYERHRYDNGWHDRAARYQGRYHSYDHYYPAPPPRHWHQQQHHSGYGYSSYGGWPYGVSSAQFVVTIPLQ
jgi:hypothetical protein